MSTIYIIGRYIRKYNIPNLFIKYKISLIIILIVLMFIVNSVISYFKPGEIVGYFAYDSSVFILILSILFFHTVVSKSTTHNNIVNKLSLYAFPLYLFSDFVWLCLKPYIIVYKDSFKAWLVMPCCLIIAFVATFIYEEIRSKAFSKVEKKLYTSLEKIINNENITKNCLKKNNK